MALIVVFQFVVDTFLKYDTQNWRKDSRGILVLSRLEGLLLFTCSGVIFALFAVT